MAEEDLRLTVTRSSAKKMASKIFGYSVAALISLAYINMGCALDLEVLKTVLRRPVGPAIGFVAQVIQHRDALRSHIVWVRVPQLYFGDVSYCFFVLFLVHLYAAHLIWSGVRVPQLCPGDATRALCHRYR